MNNVDYLKLQGRGEVFFPPAVQEEQAKPKTLLDMNGQVKTAAPVTFLHCPDYQNISASKADFPH